MGLATVCRVLRVEGIDACDIEPWAARVGRRRGFSVTGQQADVFGVCASCQRARAT